MIPLRTSDNSNGSFSNPLIFADYPDPDIIRVGADFYMVSSSFTCVPGIPICHSTDLLNWKIIGHAYNGIQLVLRASDVFGPYEWRVVSGDDMNYAGAGLHQGGFVELEGGETWYFMFQDRDWVGRVPVLQPVRWVEDWPVLGDPENDGKSVVTWQRPSLPAGERFLPEGSDDFNRPELNLRWQWNHHPEDSRWSLAERPGWLRLRPLKAPDLAHARNTLTQKMVGPQCSATVTLDGSMLPEEATAGLCVLNLPYAWIGMRIRDGIAEVVCTHNGEIMEVQSIDAQRILRLRVDADAAGLAHFSYAIPGGDFVSCGGPFSRSEVGRSFPAFPLRCGLTGSRALCLPPYRCRWRKGPCLGNRPWAHTKPRSVFLPESEVFGSSSVARAIPSRGWTPSASSAKRRFPHHNIFHYSKPPTPKAPPPNYEIGLTSRCFPCHIRSHCRPERTWGAAC